MAIRKIFILAGPTGVGKTEIGFRWALEHRAHIINADSLLFYKGMDIGTGKPPTTKQIQVKHHLINVSSPNIPFSIKQYVEVTKNLIHEVVKKKGKDVLVVGGSGFYLKSFLKPVADYYTFTPKVRNFVRLMEKKGLIYLIASLREVSPEGTGSVDLNNPRRIACALARCLSSGICIPKIETLFYNKNKPFSNYIKHVCLLTATNNIIKQRITSRTEEMLKNYSLVKEVQTLLINGFEKNPSAAKAIGYRETIAWLKKHSNNSITSLKNDIENNTQRLVVKQNKWFSHQLPTDYVLTRSKNDDEILYTKLCSCFNA